MDHQRLVELGDFTSPGLVGSRRVQVWLPPAAMLSGAHALPVLLFHDGQNLFQVEESFLGVTWKVPTSMDQLAAEGFPALAVGIWNGGRRRLAEYSPPFSLGGSGLVEAHLDLLESRILPEVQRQWPAGATPAQVGLVGSSLGGLASLWGALSRPDIFGLCAALSPSLGFGGRRLYDLALQRGPAPWSKLYLDAGTREVARRRRRARSRRSPSKHYSDLVRYLGKVLARGGWVRGRHWALVSDIGGRHSEADWARRLPNALRFLLGGPAPATTTRARPKIRRR